MLCASPGTSKHVFFLHFPEVELLGHRVSICPAVKYIARQMWLCPFSLPCLMSAVNSTCAESLPALALARLLKYDVCVCVRESHGDSNLQFLAQ